MIDITTNIEMMEAEINAVVRNKCNSCNEIGQLNDVTVDEALAGKKLLRCNCVDWHSHDLLYQQMQGLENLAAQLKQCIPADYYSIYEKDKIIESALREHEGKIFVWIHAKSGTGKTLTLYRIKMLAFQKYSFFNILDEDKMKLEYGEYNIDYSTINAYNDIAIKLEKQHKHLIPFYEALIDNALNKRTRLYFTSNFSPKVFIDMIARHDSYNAMRIKSRLMSSIGIMDYSNEPDWRLK